MVVGVIQSQIQFVDLVALSQMDLNLLKDTAAAGYQKMVEQIVSKLLVQMWPLKMVLWQKFLRLVVLHLTVEKFAHVHLEIVLVREI